MKAAIIVSADSAQLFQSAAEVNALLSELTSPIDALELWVVCTPEPPPFIPKTLPPVQTVRYVRILSPVVPELILQQLTLLQAEHPQELLLFTPDELGQELCTRLAFRLGGSSAVNVESCRLTESPAEVRKRVYGSNLVATLQLQASPYCLTPHRQAVPPADRVSATNTILVEAPASSAELGWLRQYHSQPEKLANDLTGAEVVLALGNGVRNRDELRQLEDAASVLGAEIGVSRPLAMNGWTEMSRQIGASGRILSPRLTIAAGVSGSAVFSCGIENSQFLVAVNIDPQAPIFNHADVGIIDDLFAILADLAAIVSENKKPADHPTSPPGPEGGAS